MGTAAAAGGRERPGDGASPGARRSGPDHPGAAGRTAARPAQACGPPSRPGSRTKRVGHDRSRWRAPWPRRVVPRGRRRRPRPSSAAARAGFQPVPRSPARGPPRCPTQLTARATSPICPQRRPARDGARGARPLAGGRDLRPVAGADPAARAGRSTRGRRPPTACPACTTSRPGCSRTSSPASRPCRASTSPARRAGTATGCRSRSPSRRNSGCPARRTIEAYGIAEFNARCRESVLRHVDAFEELTERMGYWVDLSARLPHDGPGYIESVWWSLKVIFDKGLLVRDFRISPYCPRCGTPLSDHELGQPDVLRDRHRPVGQRPLPAGHLPEGASPLLAGADLLVWTTTPWTLVSNTAVAVHPGRDLRGRAQGRPGRRGGGGRDAVRLGAGRGLAGRWPGSRGRAGGRHLPAAVRPGRHPRRAPRGARPTS